MRALRLWPIVLALLAPTAPDAAPRWKVTQTIPGHGEQLLLTSDALVPVLLTATSSSGSSLMLTLGRSRRRSKWAGQPTRVRFPTLPAPSGVGSVPLKLTTPTGLTLYRATLSIRVSSVPVDHSPSPDLEGLHNELQVLTVGPSLHSAQNAFQLGYSVDAPTPVFARLSLSSVRRPARTRILWMALKPGKGQLPLDLGTLCNPSDFDNQVRLSGALLDADGRVLTAEQTLAVWP